MGPDEEKDYNSAMFMHYNPGTEKWEEVGKLKDIKEIEIDDRDVEYMVLPVQLHFDIKESLYRYIPVQNNMVFYAKDYNSAINGMIKRFGTVVKIIEPDRRRGLLANRSTDIDNIITRLYERSCENGYVWSMSKIVEVFEPINTKCKNYTLYFLIKVR